MPSPGNRIGTQAESHPCQRDQFSTLRDVPRALGEGLRSFWWQPHGWLAAG